MPSPAPITRIAMIVYVPLAVVALCWAWFADGRAAWSLETHWLFAPYSARAAASLGLGALVALLVVATTPQLVKRTRWARALHEELREVVAPLSSAEINLLALASGLSEELFFRGALLPVVGLLVSSIIFGALHVGPKRLFLAWAAWAFGMGLVFGWIFELTGVLWGPVLSHVWINQRNMTFIQRH